MWPTFQTEKPVDMLPAIEDDLTVTSIAFGFTLGFGWFVTYHAVQMTRRAPRWSAFVIMCWLEILVCSIFAIICILYMRGVIPYSFWIYFSIVTCWAFQVQFLLQIIVNRVCVLLHRPESRMRLKLSIAIWITTINITVYCIWIPAKLQVSQKYHDINVWWDRTEKCLYLLTDAILNGMFVIIVRKRLVNVGLKKYDRLVKFNQYIIFVSLAMDVLIIGMMSYRNDFAYLQFHPLAYMVKLEIEMTMSKLIIKVAKSTGVQVYVLRQVHFAPWNAIVDSEVFSPSQDGHEISTSGPSNQSNRRISHRKISMPVEVNVATHIVRRCDLETEGHEMKDVESCQSGPGIPEHQSQPAEKPSGDMVPFPQTHN